MTTQKKTTYAGTVLFALALALTACGGSVEAEPPACPDHLNTLRYSEPTPDPTGTSEAAITACLTPEGERALVSKVWCCL